MRVAPYALALVAAVQTITPAALAAQDETYVAPPEELALANVIIEAMYPADKREAMLLELSRSIASQYMAGAMTGPMFQEPGIRAIMDRFVADLPDAFRPIFAKQLPRIFDATAIAYTREFTLEELQDIARFAQTPNGSRYFVNLQKLQSDPAIAAANQAYFAELGPLARTMGAEVGKEVETYLRANPDVVERLKKAGVGKNY